MSLSLTDRLNSIAKQQQGLLTVSKTEIFNTEFFANRDDSLKRLLDDFAAIENDAERAHWLKSMFNEMFQTIFVRAKNNTELVISLDDISNFINDLTKIRPTQSNMSTSSIVGKMFIATSNTIPEILQNEKDLIAIANHATRIHSELFKFSWLSSKLSTRPQIQLLRHLLKKSKYEIKKFNLLSESAVGFSELVMLIVTAYNDDDNLLKISHYIKELKYICGKYSLDHMRSLDIFLSVSSTYVTENYKFMIEFLSKSDLIKNGNSNILLAKIVSFNLNKKIHDSKYTDMCAILVKMRLLDAKLVWNNIFPTTEELDKLIRKTEDKLEEECMKGIENPLAMAAALTNDEDDKISYGEDKTESTQISGNTTENETEQKLETQNLIIFGKIGLLKSLLLHGCFDEASDFLRNEPKYILLDDKIAVLVARIFEHMVSHLYNALSPPVSSGITASLRIVSNDNGLITNKPRLIMEQNSHFPETYFELNTRFNFYFKEWSDKLPQITTIDELFKESHYLYSLIGFNLAKNPGLISQICRIAISDINRSGAENGDVLDRWVSYFRKFIFPTIPLLGINPSVTNQVYALMKLFPFERRYFMYNEMITKLSQDVLSLRVKSNVAERETRNILKALSTDTVSMETRRLANLVSSNPLATLTAVVKQIENYDKVSELVVYSTRYFNDFAYDVLQYILLLRLTQSRSALQEDGVNQAMWAQRLSIFISGLAKNCPQMDISNIIIFVIKKLHEGNPIATSILKELLNRVAGIRDLVEVNNKRIIMLNSGEPLRKQARKLIFDTRDSNLELARKLMRLFQKENSLSEIIILLYNLKSKASSDNGHYKILSARSDELNTLLWSFIELVNFCLKGDAFSTNVVSFKMLLSEHNISTPWAFHIWRDFMDKSEDTTSGKTFNIETFLNGVKFDNIDLSKISRSLFVNFWRYSLYDIHFEKKIYDDAKSNLENELSNSELSTKKRNSLTKKIRELSDSCISHEKIFHRITNQLNEESIEWYKDLSDEDIQSFLQYCIIPRVLFAPSDAIYTTFFILQCFPIDYVLKIFKVLVYSNILNGLLFSATSSEAGNLGTFFSTLLEVFELRRKNGDFSDGYKRQLYDLHTEINNQLIDLLNEKNYMSIRNVIEFMKHVSSVFPVIETHIELLVLVLENNLVNETREDINLPTSALIGHLKARLRKENILLHDFCELNAEELEVKEQLDAEQKEIDNYETSVENEKKQLELRKQLELNKLKRESQKEQKRVNNQEETRKGLDEGSSNTDYNDRYESDYNWPFSKVIGYIEEVVRDLKRNDLKHLLNYIRNEEYVEQLENLFSSNIPLRDFRMGISDTLEDFFYSLVYNCNNADFKRGLEDIRNACASLTQKRNISNSDMYSEQKTEPPSKTSRYNSDNKRSNELSSNTSKIPSKPQGSSYISRRYDDSSASRSGSRFTENKENYKKQTNRMQPSSKRGYNSNSSSSNSDFVKLPDRPSSEKPSKHTRSNQPIQSNNVPNRGFKRELPTGPDNSANKRQKSDTGKFNRQPRYQEVHPVEHQRRSDYHNGNDRSRFNNTNSGNSSNQQPSSKFGNSSSTKPSLPQGPKNSSNYNSRYQK